MPPLDELLQPTHAMAVHVTSTRFVGRAKAAVHLAPDGKCCFESWSDVEKASPKLWSRLEEGFTRVADRIAVDVPKSYRLTRTRFASV
jgi:hypothetical protein